MRPVAVVELLVPCPQHAHRSHPRNRLCNVPAGAQLRSAVARTNCAPRYTASDTGAPSYSARSSRRRVAHGHGAPHPPHVQIGSTGPWVLTRAPPGSGRRSRAPAGWSPTRPASRGTESAAPTTAGNPRTSRPDPVRAPPGSPVPHSSLRQLRVPRRAPFTQPLRLVEQSLLRGPLLTLLISQPDSRLWYRTSTQQAHQLVQAVPPQHRFRLLDQGQDAARNAHPGTFGWRKIRRRQ